MPANSRWDLIRALKGYTTRAVIYGLWPQPTRSTLSATGNKLFSGFTALRSSC